MAPHSTPSGGRDGPLYLAVADLPPDLRDVVRLTLLKRWSDARVAAQLDLTVEEVKRRRSEGERRLAEVVDVEELKRRLR